jgi:hypothetical protein
LVFFRSSSHHVGQDFSEIGDQKMMPRTGLSAVIAKFVAPFFAIRIGFD